MIIAIFILSWLLINTWLTLVMTYMDGELGNGTWYEFFFLALASILNPLIWLAIKTLIEIAIVKYEKYKENKQ